VLIDELNRAEVDKAFGQRHGILISDVLRIYAAFRVHRGGQSPEIGPTKNSVG